MAPLITQEILYRILQGEQGQSLRQFAITGSHAERIAEAARRLLLSETVDAADAGFQVGYESPSQFNREYARMFGMPPLRDRKRLRDSLGLVN